MLSPLEAPALGDLAGIRHGFFTRDGGISQGIYASLNCGLGSDDDSEAVLENRKRVVRHLGGKDQSVVTVYQEHGANAVAIAEPVARDRLPRADAVVTATPGLVIGVLTADCAPVLLADPEARVVAAAHAGWRGAIAGILESAIAVMEGLGAKRERITAAVGPTINHAAYEVGPEFEAQLLSYDEGHAAFFSRAPGSETARPHFDLPGFVTHRLCRAGLGQVVRQSPCTYENESLFFSYRRKVRREEPDYGRQISAIVVA